MKFFKVMTFYEERPGRKPRVSAYTIWANPEWSGCKVYVLSAENGTAAKKAAIAMRKKDEEAAALTRTSDAR
jgi:hypothetical protein